MNKTRLIIFASLGIVIYSLIVFLSPNMKGIYQYIAYGLLGVLLILFLVLVFGIKKNKSEISKIQSLLDKNDYEGAKKIVDDAITNNRADTITLDIMRYYKIVCLIGLNENLKALETTYSIINISYYPMVYYYQAILCFTLKKQCDYNTLYVSFINNIDVKKNIDRYAPYNDLFYLLVLDDNGEIQNAKNQINKIVRSNYELKASLDAYDILFDKYNEKPVD